MVIIGTTKISLALIGLILVLFAWLIQVLAVYRRKTKTIRKGFILWYLVGTAIILADAYDGNLWTPEFILQASAFLAAFLIFVRLKR